VIAEAAMIGFYGHRDPLPVIAQVAAFSAVVWILGRLERGGYGGELERKRRELELPPKAMGNQTVRVRTVMPASREPPR
jgi:hypothetical protein